ncbi:MAG: hypothetical protein ACI36X_00840 [Bacteroidaceae bacterium]
MKKTVMCMLLLLLAVGAQAQFEKNKWFVNTSLTGLGLSYSGSEKTRFGFDAQVGNFLTDNTALLVRVGGDYGKRMLNHTRLGVGGRYYFDRVGIFLGLGLHYGLLGKEAAERSDFGLGAEVGYAFFLSRTVTLEPAIYYDQSLLHHKDYSKVGLKLGFGFYF